MQHTDLSPTNAFGISIFAGVQELKFSKTTPFKFTQVDKI